MALEAARSIVARDDGMMQAPRDGAAVANNGPREDSCCCGFCHYLGPMAARYPYAGLFVLGNFFAWIVRESNVTFFLRQRLSGCQGDRNCLQAEGVLLISMTLFLFYAIMLFSTIFTRKLQDPRSLWHSQWWLVKSVLLLVGALVLCTLIPDDFIKLYGNVAPVGAGIFISIQLISLIRWMTRLNYKWCHTNFDKHYAKVLSLSIVAYIASNVGAVYMLIRYADCWLNIVFICTTLLLVYLLLLIALKSKAKGRFMEPALVGAYIMFLCWSAIRSEPEISYHQKEKGSSAEKWETMISFVFELICIAVATFTTGNDYESIVQFRNVVESEEDIPYDYGFFHLVFATGSMYSGMLFVCWDTHHTMKKWNVDVGWLCTWVHIFNEGLAVMSFVAILLARMNGIGWLRQLLARIFGIGGQQQGGDQLQTIQLERDTGPPPSPLSQSQTPGIPIFEAQSIYGSFV